MKRVTKNRNRPGPVVGRMVPPVDLNPWAMLVAVPISLTVGALWYSPVLFGKVWQRWTGVTDAQLADGKAGGLAIVWAAVAAFGTAYIFSHVLDFAQATTVVDALLGALFMWAGFVVPVLLVHNRFERRPAGLLALNAAQHLVELVPIAILLTLWT